MRGGVTEPLEHHHAASFATHETVRRVVKRLAASIDRQHVRATEGDERFRRQNQVHTAGERQIALARTQALAGEVHRHQ